MSGKSGTTRKKDHELIRPPVDLSHAIDACSFSGVDFDAIARAEEALGQLSGNFRNWMAEEVASLVSARARVRSARGSAESLSALFHCAHDIKGEGETLGYPLAAEAAASLCRLLEGVSEPQRTPMLLLDQHVDAIRAIVREEADMRAQETGRRLVDRLAEVTADFIAREKDRAAPADEVDTAA